MKTNAPSEEGRRKEGRKEGKNHFFSMIAKTSKSIDEASLQFSKVAQLPNLGPAPSYRVGKDTNVTNVYQLFTPTSPSTMLS